MRSAVKLTAQERRAAILRAVRSVFAEKGDDRDVPLRLMLRSLAEDGAFARSWLRRLADEWVPKVEACARAAVASGEAVDGPVRADLGAWFAHHLAVMLMLHLLPAAPVVD